MKLIQGIKLFLADEVPTLPTCVIEVSSGTRSANDGSENDQYADASFVPRIPWRELTDAETFTLLSSTVPTGPYGQWIAVIRVPPDVLEAYAPIRVAIGSGAPFSEIKQLISSPECKSATNFALQYVQELVDGQHPLVEAPIVHLSPANMLTTTMNAESRPIGLHVDSWYRLELKDRQGAPNRLSINLGVEPRYFLYINLSLQKMADLLQEYFPNDPAHREVGVGIGLRTVFMQRFPDYPVVKLRVHPGDAYIAPTENLIHDGCTIGQGCADVQLNVRGRFVISNYATRSDNL